jgi:hypothetical protein
VERYKGTLDMSGMAVTEKAQYLIQREYLGSQMEDIDKGAEARSIRELVHVGGMPNGETYNRLKNLDQLFGINETFMNVTLRDFLNLNGQGMTEYLWEGLTEADGWKEMESVGSAMHQNEIVDGELNAKITNKDGRELVFASNKDLVTNRLDKGTYNYVDGNVFTSIPLIGGHWNYDMAPYNAQMKGERLKLAVNWDYLFRGNSHTWKNNRE